MNSQPSVEPNSELGRGTAVGISLFSLLAGLLLGVWTWLLRDGLGPDSMESSGIEAFRRFFAQFWPVAVFCFVLFAIAFFVARRQPSSSNASTNEPGNV